jgi:RND family efflux transporter MFP subunit
MKYLRIVLQILLPLLVLAGGAFMAQRILANKVQPKVTAPVFEGPLVRVAAVAPTALRIDVTAQGTVEPFRAVTVAPQVAGRVLRVADELRAGAFVAAGATLLCIEPADFELQIVQRQADVARAALRLVQERAEAAAALRAWRELEGERAPEPLVTREPQIRDAEQSLAAAEAQLARARLDLERTQVTAPFAARVRSANAEVGQFVAVGAAVAELYDVAAVEIRLPIASSDAAFLDLPMLGTGDAGTLPTVEVSVEFAGRRHVWQGRIVRTEGELDRRTRQLTLVARVDEPYARHGDGDRPPLTVGMFVQATITGRTFADVVAVPRSAVSADGEVWVVDQELRLRRRTVAVLRLERERALVQSGLAAGERVLSSRLDAPQEGMPVRAVEPTAQER